MAHARAKLLAKGLDLIVANDITAPDAGFAADTNRVVLLDREESAELPLMSKSAVPRRSWSASLSCWPSVSAR